MTHRCHNRRTNLEESLAERIAKDRLKREACWTESLAVGSVSFPENFEPEITSRRSAEVVNTADGIYGFCAKARFRLGKKTASKNAP